MELYQKGANLFRAKRVAGDGGVRDGVCLGLGVVVGIGCGNVRQGTSQVRNVSEDGKITSDIDEEVTA